MKEFSKIKFPEKWKPYPYQIPLWNYLRSGGRNAAAIWVATNCFFKLNLMDWWDNSFKSSLSLVLSNYVAHYALRPYREAPIELKNNLLRYGIGQENWKILKSFVRNAKDEKKYIIPPSWDEDSLDILPYLKEGDSLRL